MSKINYSQEISNRFNLSYPDLNDRKQQFTDRLIEVINHLSKIRRSGVFNEPCRSVDTILDGSELDQIRFENGCDYIDIFEDSSSDFERILFWFTYLLHLSSRDIDIPIYDESTLVKLMRMFENMNFEYEIDVIKNMVKRKLDTSTTSVINQNIEAIKDQGQTNADAYSKCIDDFIKISPKTTAQDYYEALGRMKKVLERTIGKEIKKSGKSVWLAKTDTILDAVFKDNKKQIETQRKSLEFIKENIHHDKEDKNGVQTPYKFNKTEFVYWWLQMNAFIYLINQK